MVQFVPVDQHIYRLNLLYKDIYTSVMVLVSHHGNILFDTAFTQADVETQILPAYRQLGIDDPKFIFISHNHIDHAGGLPWVLEAFPQATVLSRSPALREKYPHRNVIAPEDGALISEDFRVVTIPGHTPDSAALLDLRTGSLLTGDCLQGYGIYGSGAWGAVIPWIELHLQALKKLHTMDIRAIHAAHDYHPYGESVSGKEAAMAYVDGCLAALLRVRDILKNNWTLDDEGVAALCNDGKLPRVPARIVTALREAVDSGVL